jgi:signal transduction histidine kinase
LKEQNRVLQQEIQDRERAEHALKLLIRTVSHDLKNPITGFSLVLKNILQKHTDDSAQTADSEEAIAVPSHVLERMADSAEHQLNLIHSLLNTHTLDVTYGSSSALPPEQSVLLHYKPVAFHQLVHRVIREIEPLAEKHQSTIQNQVPSNLPLVYADPDQLQRVLDNLITNGIKHNPPDVRVTVTAEAKDAQLHCTVRDDGRGIPSEDQAQLFQPYRRVAAQANTPGLGLGLYLCRQIIQAHGGDIHLSSHPGEGSSFQFTLPLASSDIPNMTA